MPPLQGKVLAVSPISGYGEHNTSLHRVHSLRSLGYEVTTIDSALSGKPNFSLRLSAYLFRKGFDVRLPDSDGIGEQLMHLAQVQQWDILWLEKALLIDGELLRQFKERAAKCTVIGYSPDDMNARHNQSAQFLSALPHYDYFITTKSYNVQELSQLGCPKCVFVGNAYDPEVFRPLDVAPADRDRLGGDVGFIGSFEIERAESMLHLAEGGVSVRVWGGGWERFKKTHPSLRIEGRPLYGDDYARACGAFKINLCFLRKINRDLQTTRSVELPACGGFMLAERSEEHLELFSEGEEAEFLATDEELLEKCRRYLKDDEARVQLASAGLERCKSSGYDNASRIRHVLGQIFG